MSKNLRCILSVARTEFVGWITNPRMLMAGVMLVFVRNLAVVPLLEHAEKYGKPLNVLEPFIAVGNSGILTLLMPCVFMALLSDYPKITADTLLAMPRTGRKNWYAGQVLFRFLAVASFLLVMLAGSVLVSRGEFGREWSDTVTKYAYQFPKEAYSYASRLLPSNLYNQMSVTMAVVHTLLLLGLYLLLLSEVMCLFQLLHLQPYGLMAAMAVMAAGMVTCSLDLPSMWYFPLANAIIWLHYDVILSELTIPVWYSYGYLLVLNGACMGVNLFLASRLQFLNTERNL